ncbi:MAG: leucine-rich repeat domain-containing protein [Isosphaeraceae bacterium]|nr:leucine-rich repeat domain-containing protein [Isosphaeraceae bacterium]
MNQSTLTNERIFTEEEAARFLRRRARRRWAVRMLLGVFLVAGLAVGPPVFEHLRTLLWLTMLGVDVNWELNDENWTQGGVTSVSLPIGFRTNGQFENRNVAELRGLRHLQSLDLSNAFDVSALGLADLKRLPELKVLDLGRIEDKASPIVAPPPKFSDNDLVRLEPLTGLRELNLSGNRITDAGLVHLSGLTDLEVLDLEETDVTDAGLQQLRPLTKLKVLRVGKAKGDKRVISANAAMALNQALPELVIHLKKEYETE